jgi:hypothetical protein
VGSQKYWHRLSIVFEVNRRANPLDPEFKQETALPAPTPGTIDDAGCWRRASDTMN